jgi:hypothetical protein
MAVSGGRLYIGGTFKTVNAVARTGTVDVDKFDITPDGSRLIAIGNWTSVAGLRRDQIVMLALAASPVAVTGWSTTRYQQQCAAVFATYMRDVDVSPDGSYFMGHDHRRLPCRQPMRRRRPEPAAHLGRLHRRRHPLQRRRHRDRGLCRRPPALDEQQRRRRPGRPGRGRPRGHRRPRPGQQPALASGRLIYATTTGTLSNVDLA